MAYGENLIRYNVGLRFFFKQKWGALSMEVKFIVYLSENGLLVKQECSDYAEA